MRSLAATASTPSADDIDREAPTLERQHRHLLVDLVVLGDQDAAALADGGIDLGARLDRRLLLRGV